MEKSEQETNSDDAVLIADCRARRAGAWEAVVARYGGFVYTVCRSTGLGEVDAAEVVQQTFGILYDSLDRLKAQTRLGPWLATVARRHSWRIRARQQREAAEAPDVLAERVEALGEGTAQGGETWELLEWLNHGLAQIDRRCRDLLTELYLKAEPTAYEAVAARFGIALGSIGPTRARCLEKLRGLLET